MSFKTCSEVILRSGQALLPQHPEIPMQTTVDRTLLSTIHPFICLVFALRSLTVCVTTLKPCHVSPGWGELHVEGGLQVPITFFLLSLGPEVRYPWLVNQDAQCLFTWEGLHSKFGFFIISPASLVYAHSDICNNGMVITSTTSSLEAHEILCFIDSFFFFIQLLGLAEYSLHLALLEVLGDIAVSRADVASYSCGKNSQWNTSKMNPY